MPNLKLHSVIRYNCTKCKKVFSVKEKFKNHMNSHGVGRESMCAICGKRFSRPNHLKAHEKIHIDGEQVDSVVLNINNESDVVAPPRKLFTCKLCGQQFESGS